MSTKKDPLPIRELDRYHARPSNTEPGQWAVMEQIKGETSLRLFARARDVIAAARILEALRGRYGVEVEQIKPAGFAMVSSAGSTGPEDAVFNVYADGSVFRATDADGVPMERVPKKVHGAWFNDEGRTLGELVAGFVAAPSGEVA